MLETKYPGVTRVRGSSRLQTAYRLEKEADLVVPTRFIHCSILQKYLRIGGGGGAPPPTPSTHPKEFSFDYSNFEMLFLESKTFLFKSRLILQRNTKQIRK